MKKIRIDKHYICKGCGGCYFAEKDSALKCYDEHTKEELESYLESHG